MLESQRIASRQSEIRERLNALQGQESLTESEQTEIDELAKEYRESEPRYRAALVTEDTQVSETKEVDAEERERLELREKCLLTNYLQARLSGQLPSGAEAEFSAACESGQDIPLDLFEGKAEERETEERAVTSAPGTVGVNMAPIQPAIFAPSIAAFAGIDMPMVGTGTFGQATISTSLGAAARTKGQAADASPAAFTVRTATPKRVSARLEFVAEDVASAGVSNFESALRQNLSMALSAELDNQLINGDGARANLAGLFNGIGAITAATADATFDTAIKVFADLVDGLWATEFSHIRAVMGVDTYKRLLRVWQVPATGGLGDVSAISYLNEHSGGIRTNARMPAATARVQSGIAFRSGRMGIRTAVAPHWGRLAITDIYSGSASAQTAVTFHVLLGNVLITQPGAYAGFSIKHPNGG